MPNPYADRYKGLSVDFKKVEGKRKKGGAAAQQRADWMGLAGSLAPIAGTGIGAAIGTAVAPGVGTVPGALIGGAAGSALGAGANFGADQQTQSYEEEEAKRRARYEAVSQILGNMRR